MRGLIGTLFGPEPSLEEFRLGLIVLSCSESYAARIAARAMEWMPHVQWTVMQRFEPGISGAEIETIYSSHAVSIPRKIAQLARVRKQRFDVVVVACTNEASFIPLKVFALVTGSQAFAVFNENIDAYFLHRKSIPVLLDHWRWRLSLSYHHRPGRLFAIALSWLFLFPLGCLYLLSRVLFLVARKKLRW